MTSFHALQGAIDMNPKSPFIIHVRSGGEVELLRGDPRIGVLVAELQGPEPIDGE